MSSHIPAPCTSCAHTNGWITCPQCNKPFCFDHCVGHGCPYTGPRPTLQLPTNEHDPAYLHHSWLWSRLHVVLHAMQTLSFSDSTQSRHMTIFAPSLSASHPWYYYTVNGIGQQPFTSAPAESLEDLVHLMHSADHHRLLFQMLGIFVQRQRVASSGHVGVPIHDLMPSVLRRRGQIADKPTLLIDMKEE